MQDDDTQNPAFLWVEQGRALWTQPAGAGMPCAGCHGDLAAMKGVAARYPAWDAQRGRPVTLPDRVNLCRTDHQNAPKLTPESDAMLALAAAIGLQSRGLPVAPPDPRLAPSIAEGERLFRTRFGQLDLSCAQCHEARAGQKLGGAVIPEGHANGYPEYRLEWQGMGSFARRLRACLAGVRAEPFAPDSAEAVALEAFPGRAGTGVSLSRPRPCGRRSAPPAEAEQKGHTAAEHRERGRLRCFDERTTFARNEPQHAVGLGDQQ